MKSVIEGGYWLVNGDREKAMWQQCHFERYFMLYMAHVNVICNPHSDHISRRGKESYINFVGSVRVATYVAIAKLCH